MKSSVARASSSSDRWWRCSVRMWPRSGGSADVDDEALMLTTAYLGAGKMTLAMGKRHWARVGSEAHSFHGVGLPIVQITIVAATNATSDNRSDLHDLLQNLRDTRSCTPHYSRRGSTLMRGTAHRD